MQCIPVVLHSVIQNISFPMHFQVYDFPPSVSKDVPDIQSTSEETYDVPPHFAKLQPQVSISSGQYLHNNFTDDDNEPPIPEDVYDVPPPILTDKHYHGDRGGVSQAPQEIYDIPAILRSRVQPAQDVYDFPREREEKDGERGEEFVYDVPPQVWQLEGQFNVVFAKPVDRGLGLFVMLINR